MCHAVNNMREVGNYVKVISKTISGGRSKELIPIGTICRIKEVCREDDDTPYYGITPIDKEDVPFYYPEKELEKDRLCGCRMYLIRTQHRKEDERRIQEKNL